MSNENLLPIVKSENIAPILQKAPESYQANQLSSQRCDAAGKAILDAINAVGMTDDLDQKAATFIDKARRTVKAMNERRTPVTKLFDQIRGAYTCLENSIDPTKNGTIAFQLQAKRNEYAAKKRAEEDQRQREQLAKQQHDQAITKFNLDIEDDMKRQLQNQINGMIQTLQTISQSLTLENYEAILDKVKNIPTDLSQAWFDSLTTTVPAPYSIRAETVQLINDKKAAIRNQFFEQYKYEAETNRDYILDRLPSKKAELERIAKANAEEAAILQKEKEAREAAEAKQREEERQKKELENIKKQQAQRQAVQMQGLFDNQATLSAYQPKSKVTKKIHLLNPEGIMPVIAMWWNYDGYKLTIDELAKMFKKQITFVEKLANAKEPTLIEDESVEYVDEVKAK